MVSPTSAPGPPRDGAVLEVRWGSMLMTLMSSTSRRAQLAHEALGHGPGQEIERLVITRMVKFLSWIWIFSLPWTRWP